MTKTPTITTKQNTAISMQADRTASPFPIPKIEDGVSGCDVGSHRKVAIDRTGNIQNKSNAAIEDDDGPFAKPMTWGDILGTSALDFPCSRDPDEPESDGASDISVKYIESAYTCSTRDDDSDEASDVANPVPSSALSRPGASAGLSLGA